MQEGLLTGRLDIALLYNPSPSPELDTQPLMEEELYLIALRAPRTPKTRDLPITLKEEAELPLVIPSRPNAIRMLVETQMAGIGCKPLVSLEIDGVAAILDLVADGAGNAILPRYALASSSKPESYLVRPILKPRLGSKLALATASGRTTTLTQQAMLDLIREVALAVFGQDQPQA